MLSFGGGGGGGVEYKKNQENTNASESFGSKPDDQNQSQLISTHLIHEFLSDMQKCWQDGELFIAGGGGLGGGIDGNGHLVASGEISFSFGTFSNPCPVQCVDFLAAAADTRDSKNSNNNDDNNNNNNNGNAIKHKGFFTKAHEKKIDKDVLRFLEGNSTTAEKNGNPVSCQYNLVRSHTDKCVKQCTNKPYEECMCPCFKKEYQTLNCAWAKSIKC